MHTAILADQTLRGLALSVARNNVGAMLPLQQVLANENLTQAEYDLIAQNPQFQRYIALYTSELKDSGFSFSAKSRILAEDLLPTVYHMARDPDVPAPVRMKSIENLVEWGDLKPKTTLNQAPGGGFSITINLPGTLNSPPEKLILEAESHEKSPETPQICMENAPEIVLPKHKKGKKREKVTSITFDEPEDYEYAGDDCQ